MVCIVVFLECKAYIGLGEYNPYMGYMGAGA
jgi:hypothetical protein